MIASSAPNLNRQTHLNGNVLQCEFSLIAYFLIKRFSLIALKKIRHKNQKRST